MSWFVLKRRENVPTTVHSQSFRAASLVALKYTESISPERTFPGVSGSTWGFRGFDGNYDSILSVLGDGPGIAFTATHEALTMQSSWRSGIHRPRVNPSRFESNRRAF